MKLALPMLETFVAVDDPNEVYSYISPQVSVTCGGPAKPDLQPPDPSNSANTLMFVPSKTQTLLVRQGFVWLGVDWKDSKGAMTVVDVGFWLYNFTRGIIFDGLNDDHYTWRTGMENNRSRFDFRPGYMTIRPNDSMALYLGMAGGSIAQAAAFCVLYYQVAP